MGGLPSIKILHPLRMVLASHRSENQVVQNLQVFKKGHIRSIRLGFVGEPRRGSDRNPVEYIRPDPNCELNLDP
jgi:hypothetical protein